MPTIAPVFVAEPTYAPDAAERREPFREGVWTDVAIRRLNRVVVD